MLPVSYAPIAGTFFDSQQAQAIHRLTIAIRHILYSCYAAQIRRIQILDIHCSTNAYGFNRRNLYGCVRQRFPFDDYDKNSNKGLLCKQSALPHSRRIDHALNVVRIREYRSSTALFRCDSPILHYGYGGNANHCERASPNALPERETTQTASQPQGTGTEQSRNRHSENVAKRPPSNFFKDFAEGIRYVKSEKGLLAITLYFFVISLCGSIQNTLAMPYFRTSQGLFPIDGTLAYIIVYGCSTVGRLIGGMVQYKVKFPAKGSLQ